MENKSVAHRIFIPVLLFILAYEWIISSINKMVVHNYYGNLHTQMSQSISGIQVQPYANLLKTVGLPNSHLFGLLVLVGELVVGVVFIILAVRMFQGTLNPVMGTIGIIASLLAAFMSLNYALLGGDTLFVDPANAFQEGISVDWMLFLIEVSLAIYFYSTTTQSNKEKQRDKGFA